MVDDNNNKDMFIVENESFIDNDQVDDDSDVELVLTSKCKKASYVGKNKIKISPRRRKQDQEDPSLQDSKGKISL